MIFFFLNDKTVPSTLWIFGVRYAHHLIGMKKKEDALVGCQGRKWGWWDASRLCKQGGLGPGLNRLWQKWGTIPEQRKGLEGAEETSILRAEGSCLRKGEQPQWSLQANSVGMCFADSRRSIHICWMKGPWVLAQEVKFYPESSQANLRSLRRWCKNGSFTFFGRSIWWL